MNDRQIEYMLTIAEEGSISSAAKKLFISQPSLSQMLINIEKQYGITLFNRSENPLTPTFAGQKFLESIREITQIEKRLKQEFEEISGSYSGKISLGISSTKALYILPAIIPEFQKSFPKVELNIIDGTNPELEEMLLSRNIDLAVLNYTSFHNRLEYVKLPEEEMLLVLPKSHQIIQKADTKKTKGLKEFLSLKMIANEPFIYLYPNHGVRIRVDNIFMTHGINPPKIFEVANNALAHTLVASGTGITILPDSFIRYIAHNRQKCAYFSISEGSFHRKAAICFPSDPKLSKSMSFLVNLIQQKSFGLFKKANISPLNNW